MDTLFEKIKSILCFDVIDDIKNVLSLLLSKTIMIRTLFTPTIKQLQDHYQKDEFIIDDIVYRCDRGYNDMVDTDYRLCSIYMVVKQQWIEKITFEYIKKDIYCNCFDFRFDIDFKKSNMNPQCLSIKHIDDDPPDGPGMLYKQHYNDVSTIIEYDENEPIILNQDGIYESSTDVKWYYNPFTI